MTNNANGQALINTFFEALERGQIAECEQVQAQLRGLSGSRPDYLPWCDYFEGVLANVRDHDWARAEQIYRDLLGGDLDAPLQGRVLLGLGLVLEYQGHWLEAIATHERSLSLFTKLAQPLDQAKAWKNMASAWEGGFMQGDLGREALNQAEVCCQRTLDILQNTPDLWLEATTYDILGLIYKHLRRWPEAIDCHQHSLTLAQRLGDDFGIGAAYGNLGEIYQLQEPPDFNQALTAYQQALAIFRRYGSLDDLAEALTNLAELYRAMEDLPAALEHYEQALQIIETLRSGQASESGRAGYFTTVAHTYANAVLLCLDTGDLARAFNTVERARARAFLDTLAARAEQPDLAAKVDPTILTLADVQAVLPPDTLLLEYFTSGLIEAGPGSAGSQSVARHRFPPEQTLLFAVTRDRIELHILDLPLNALRPRQLDNIVELRFLKAAMRRTLYDKLIAPVAPLLADKRRLYLVPHGLLHYVPFQALLAPDGETLLREDGPQLVYASSATLLFRRRPARQQPAARPCLAVGYNSEGDSQLRLAEDEARRIVQLTGGETLVGSALSKTAFYDRAGAYRLIHLACHGQFDPESPLASFLHLAPGEQLTALEVIDRLRLNCDLVTLSACESGLSRIRRGDELIGFMRAFMVAGTPALVSTLWRVDDHATRILMEKFYQEIQNGLDLAGALKRAQLYVKNMTYQEALTAVASMLTADDAVSTAASEAESRQQGPRSEPGGGLQRAGAYLRGEAARGRGGCAELAADTGASEKVFENPCYWAAFVLFGPYDV